MSPRAQSARHSRSASMPARIGTVPRATTPRPPGGSPRTGNGACPCPLFSFPFPCLRHGGLSPVRTSSVCTTCSCRPLLRPCRHSPWTPHPVAARAVWGASSTPGPALWPPIRMSMTSSRLGHCRPTARSGSHPARRTGVFRCERCRTSSGARARRRSPKPTGSIMPPPPSGNRHGSPMVHQSAPAKRASPPSPPPADALPCPTPAWQSSQTAPSPSAAQRVGATRGHTGRSPHKHASDASASMACPRASSQAETTASCARPVATSSRTSGLGWPRPPGTSWHRPTRKTSPLTIHLPRRHRHDRAPHAGDHSSSSSLSRAPHEPHHDPVHPRGSCGRSRSPRRA